MKKALNNKLGAVLAGILAICIACTAIGCQNGAKKATESVAEPMAMEEAHNHVFGTMEEYIAYMLNDGDGMSVQSNNGGGNSYYYPANVPDDATLHSIRIDGDGTMFIYSIIGRISPFYVDPNEDPYLYSLINTYRVRLYDDEMWTDREAFAANLASALGAVPYSENGVVLDNVYYGEVKARVKQPSGSYQLQQVGYQIVRIENNKVEYAYFPMTVSLNEAFEAMQFQQQTLNTDPTI